MLADESPVPVAAKGPVSFRAGCVRNDMVRAKAGRDDKLSQYDITIKHIFSSLADDIIEYFLKIKLKK